MIASQAISLPTSLSQPLAGKLGAKVHDNRAEAKLKSTAKEFEATLLSMLLKEMRQTLDEDGGLFPGDSGDVQGGLFDMFMSRHLADSGGIGLAKYLERQLHSTPPVKSVTPSDAIAPAAHPSRSVVPAAPRS